MLKDMDSIYYNVEEVYGNDGDLCRREDVGTFDSLEVVGHRSDRNHDLQRLRRQEHSLSMLKHWSPFQRPGHSFLR